METTHDSPEHPGYAVTYHRKPEEYTVADWTHMVKCLHTSKGHIVKEVLSAVVHYDDGPYPLKNRVKEHGVEVVWC